FSKDNEYKSQLKFISASENRRDNGGGGCKEVTKWASKLNELEFFKFKGLIDRDGENISSEHVKTLKRHSIENYIFDPLMLIAYLVHRSRNKSIACLNGVTNLIILKNMKADEITGLL